MLETKEKGSLVLNIKIYVWVNGVEVPEKAARIYKNTDVFRFFFDVGIKF